MRTSGTFEVKLDPQKDPEADFGRMILHKQFHGGLDATSVGQMLSVRTAVKGSAGYVALERVTGTLNGHAGSFLLQHSGTMMRGVTQLSLTVVPDSGTGALAGISGNMRIEEKAGQHTYAFDYAIEPPASSTP